MLKLTTFFSSVQHLFRNHPVCIVNSILIALSALSEILYAEYVFRCPKTPTWYYGWVFLFTPAVILFICGFVLNSNFWVVFHGCCKRHTTSMSVKIRCNAFWNAFGRALIVPGTWVFISLMDGDFYACSNADQPIDEKSENYLLYKAASKLYGWLFLFIMIASGTFVTCILRCTDHKTFLEARYAGVHQLEETTLLEEKMKEIAKAEVQRNLDALFVNNIPPKATWDKVSEVDDGNEEKAYYTPLYRWAVRSKMEDRKPGGQSDDQIPLPIIRVEQNTNEPSVQVS